MRLTVLERGHRVRARVFLSLIGRMSRVPAPDIVTMLLYRPEFLSAALLDFTVMAMRGPSFWTAGEREFLAFTTARRNHSPFCVDTHAEMTRLASAGAIDPGDPTALRPELTAVLGFVADPTSPVPDLPARAVRDALDVTLVWDIVNRLANDFGFELRDGQLHSGTRALHRMGYRFPRFLVPRGPAAGGNSDELVAGIRHAVLEAPARTSPETRAAAAFGGPLPEPADEDEIFEITVAAAVGAGLTSHEAGVRALAAG